MFLPERKTPPGTKKIVNPPNYPSKELWGPIPKEYGSFMGGRTWSPPGKVDGIPIVCKCSDIGDYMKRQLGADLIFLKKNPPSCWEDDSSIISGLSGADPPNYYISVGDRRFAQSAIFGIQEQPLFVSKDTPIGSFWSSFFKGGKRPKNRRRTQKKRVHKKHTLKRTKRNINNEMLLNFLEPSMNYSNTSYSILQ
jgi:hypothetical protein